MHLFAPADHARHDTTLIAGHAAGDLSDLDTAAAATLLSTCTSCAELHRDLVAISAAIRALPRVARSPRDFRITDDQARRLHRGSWVRSLLRPFASARSATRPLAAAFTSLGVAGLLVATFVPGLLGSPASAPSRDALGAAGGAATAAPALAPEAAGPTSAGQDPGAAAAASPGPDAQKDADGTDDLYIAIAAGSSTAPGAAQGGGTRSSADTDLTNASGQPNPIVLASLGLVLLGLAMFGLRFAGRRLR